MTGDPSGVIMCSRYAFAPNSLHFCGPEKQLDMKAYVSAGTADEGLSDILHRFETLYPYLRLIASANNLSDPFDRRVVEAYWIGNSLLGQVRVRPFAGLLTDTLQLSRKTPAGILTPMIDRAVTGVPHHTVHVMNIFIRTGHMAIAHTLNTMDSCRISWGIVVRSPDGGTEGTVLVETQPLVYENNRLTLGIPVQKEVVSVGVMPKAGDWVSIHWGIICDIITPRQKNNVIKYTQLAIQISTSHI